MGVREPWKRSSGGTDFGGEGGESIVAKQERKMIGVSTNCKYNQRVIRRGGKEGQVPTPRKQEKEKSYILWAPGQIYAITKEGS